MHYVYGNKKRLGHMWGLSSVSRSSMSIIHGRIVTWSSKRSADEAEGSDPFVAGCSGTAERDTEAHLNVASVLRSFCSCSAPGGGSDGMPSAYGILLGS